MEAEPIPEAVEVVAALNQEAVEEAVVPHLEVVVEEEVVQHHPVVVEEAEERRYSVMNR